MHGAGPPLDDRYRLAVELAEQAGRLTLDWFRASSLQIDEKSDGTPVTQADRAAEAFIRDEVQRRYPMDGFIGEEFGEVPSRNGLRWIVDPIDGTQSFVHGVPLYGCLVAVEHTGDHLRDHTSVIGVIHMPALGETVHAARGAGAWSTRDGHAPVRASVSSISRLSEAMFVYTSNDYFRATAQTEVLNTLLARCGRTRGWSDCYAHLLVATGRAELAVEAPVLHPWDIAPMTIILAEAGGRCTDWTGASTAYGKSGLSTNAALYDQVMALIQGV